MKLFLIKLLGEAREKPVEALGVIIVFCYTVFAGVQACEMITATNASRVSAEAAAASVRAWVYPVEIMPPSPKEIRYKAVFPIEFQNGGRTPASDLRISEQFMYWEIGTQMPTLSACPSGRGDVFAYGALKPDQAVWIRPPAVDVNLNDQQVAKLSAQKAGLVVHTCLGYQTVFDGQKGTTEYCAIAYATDPKATAPCLPTSLKMR